MLRPLSRRSAAALLCLLAVGAAVSCAPRVLFPPALQPRPAGVENLAPDRAFYSALERLLDRRGPDPADWPAGPDRWTVRSYLETQHGLRAEDCIFGRNLLGYGIGESPARARRDLEEGRTDAWGVPYDIIVASSRGLTGWREAVAAVAISRGRAVFNRELSDRPYVVLKADVHSQFCDVIRNFNGREMRIISREINFLGCPGSRTRRYEYTLRAALTAADAMRASIYICSRDGVPGIPQSWEQIGELIFGQRPQPGEDPEVEFKDVPVRVINLNQCGHAVEAYLAGMKYYGDTWLEPVQR